MHPLRWLTVPLVVVLPMSVSTRSASTGSCTVTPGVVPMETEFTISATGLRPSAAHGITIRQSGKGSYTKGIGSHPNASLDTDADGNGSTTLIAHGIDTYTDPRLVLNPDAGTVQVHIELGSAESGGGSTAGCSFDLTVANPAGTARLRAWR